MHRSFEVMGLILLGIGAMVGTGVFTITGTAAATLAGPALVISIVISALCVGLSASFLQNLLREYPLQVVPTVISMLFRRISCLVGWLVNYDGVHDSHIRRSFGLGSLF